MGKPRCVRLEVIAKGLQLFLGGYVNLDMHSIDTIINPTGELMLQGQSVNKRPESNSLNQALNMDVIGCDQYFPLLPNASA